MKYKKLFKFEFFLVFLLGELLPEIQEAFRVYLRFLKYKKGFLFIKYKTFFQDSVSWSIRKVSRMFFLFFELGLKSAGHFWKYKKFFNLRVESQSSISQNLTNFCWRVFVLFCFVLLFCASPQKVRQVTLKTNTVPAKGDPLL